MLNAYRDHRPDSDKSTTERVLGLVIKLQWWILLCLGVACGWLYYTQPLRQPVEMERLVAEARVKKATLEKEKSRLSNRIDWIKNEKDYLEVVAHDYLYRKRENEVIVSFK